jgi:hypothetical protein
MLTFNMMKAQEIVADVSLTTEIKIEQLREIEREARDLQRAASESAMNDKDGWDEDLREVRLALDKLGATEPPKGAASL